MIDTDIVIPLTEFEHLVEERKELFMLLDAIFTNCKLTQSRDNLIFHNIEQIMQIIEPTRYKNVVNRLKQEKEKEKEREETE